MAAIHCVTMLLKSGQHVLAGSDLYGGAYRLLHRICDRSGISVTLVDLTDLGEIAKALRPETGLIWAESIGNPLMTIPNLASLAEIAHRHGALLAVDNTFASPALLRPLDLGADIVMHSATKFLGGHSDVLGGTLAVKEQELRDRLYFIQNATGAVLDPLGCFLVSRGLKTLELRVREQSRTALQMAQWLRQHPSVTRVLYPGLEEHPQHLYARQLFEGSFGAMVAFEVRGNADLAARICEGTKLFHLAVSLGAVESLIEQPARMSHASYAPQDRARFGITDGLIRLSIGLEAFEDLRDDLQLAMEQA
jgi:cystathionine beta-lyase/cystathionine gamma-synthase